MVLSLYVRDEFDDERSDSDAQRAENCCAVSNVNDDGDEGASESEDDNEAGED